MKNFAGKNRRLQRALMDRNTHFKMYKAGKLWLYSGITMLTFGLVALQPTLAKADTESPANPTTIIGESDVTKISNNQASSSVLSQAASASAEVASSAVNVDSSAAAVNNDSTQPVTKASTQSVSASLAKDNSNVALDSIKDKKTTSLPTSTIAAGSLEAASLASSETSNAQTSETDTISNTGASFNNRFKALTTALPSGYSATLADGVVTVSGSSDDQLTAVKDLLAKNGLDTNAVINLTDAAVSLNGNVIDPTAVAGAEYVAANSTDFQAGMSAATKDASLLSPMVFYALSQWLTPANAGTDNINSYYAGLSVAGNFKLSGATNKVDYIAGYRYTMAQMYNGIYAFTKALTANIPTPNESTDTTYYDDLANSFWKEGTQAQAGLTAPNLASLVTLFLGNSLSTGLASNSTLAPNGIPVVPRAGNTYTYVGYKASDNSYTFLTSNTDTADYDNFFSIAQINDPINNTLSLYVGLIVDEATFNTTAHAFEQLGSMNTLGLVPTQNASAADVYAAIANNLNAVSNGLGMPATISELVSGMPEMDVNVAAYLGGKDPLSTFQLMFAYASSTLSDGFLHYIVGYDAKTQQPIYLGTTEEQTTLGVETNGVAATKDTVMQYGVRIQYGLFGDIYTQLRQAIVYAIAGAYSVQRNKDLNIIEQGDSGDNKAAYEALISAAAPTFNTSSGLTITELAQKYADYQIAQLVALRTQAATDSENGKLLTSQADFDQWMLEAKGGQAVLNAVMTDSTSNKDVAQQTTYTAATNYASFGGATKQLYYDIYLSGVDETKYSIVQVKFQGVDANGNSIVNDAISRLATKVPVDIAAVNDPGLGQAVNTTYLLGKDLLPVPPAGWIYATNATTPQQSAPTIVTTYRDPSNPYSYTVKLIQASTVTFNPVNANTGASMDGSWTETGAVGSAYNESSHQNIIVSGVTYYATDVTQLSGTFGSTDSFVTVQYLPATKVTYQFNAVDENGNSIQTTVASSWSTSGLTNDAYDMSTTIPTTLPGYTLQSGQTLTGKFGSANEILNVVFTRNVEAANVTINVTGTSTTDQLIKTVYYQIDGQGATMSVNVVQTGTSQVYTAALPNLHFGDNVTVWAVTPAGASLDQASTDHLQMQDGSNQFTLNYIIPVQNATIQIQDDTTNTALTTALPTTGSAGSAIDFADFLSKNVTGADNLNLVKILGSDGTDYTVTPAYFDDDTTTTQSFVIHVTHKIATDTATTTQTIHYVDAPSSAAVTDNVQTISWNTSHDLFADTWQATPITQTTAVESPVIAGYTPDKATVPVSSNEALTTQPADSTINVTYTANPATIIFNYVDDEESGKVVSTSATLNGVTDQAGSYNVTVPTNYRLADGQLSSISYTFGAGDTTLIVHLVHQHNIGTMTTNRTITYVGAGAKTPAAQTQPITWATDEDAVTGVITYTPTQADAVSTPAVAGYTPDQANVPATTFTATTTKPTDSTVTVTYTANPATITVTYVDDDAGGKTVGTPATLNGVTDEAGSYDVTVPTSYQLADGQLETVAYTFGIGDTALTVHLVHQHNIGSMTTNRTITYVGAGAKTPAAQTQPITWQTDEDAVTGGITYTPTRQADAVTAPTVDGYTPDQLAVSATTYTPTTTKPTDNPVTVTYTANPATITVTYVDDDTAGQIVGQPEVLNGTTDQTGSYTVIVPVNYELAKAQTPTIAYTFDAGNTALTVHLIHQHVAGTMTTNRTITYVGAGAKTPAAQIQPITWQTDEDAVTGAITYTPTTQAEAVTSLNVAGYTADQPVVFATNFPVTTTKPTDSTVTVTYTANPATITVTYVDDDTNQTVGTPETLTGVTDGTGSYTVKLPVNYQLAKDQAPTIAYTFGVGDTPLIVHLIHQHVMGTMTTNRIVTYTGAGDKTPANQTQPITWQTDEDAVTGVTTYTPTTQADAVSTPTIAGYMVDKSSVPATNFIKTTTQPTDSTVTVTYTANPATITVNYVDADDANNAVGAPVTLTGVTDGTGTYTVVVPTNYQLATGQSGAVDYVFAAGTSAMTVRLAHQHNIGTLTTNRTINYTGAGANTPAKQVQPITWQTDQDAVNGITIYTPTTQAKAVTTPSIVGYTADLTSVPDTTLAATTTHPVDSNITVTYTAVSTTFTVKATGGTTAGLGFDYSINGGPTVHAKFGDVIAATFGDAVTISNPDQQNGYTLDKKNNYAISSLGVDGSTDNMLTVNYLKNTVKAETNAVVRTIVYKVSDSGFTPPASIVQNVEFTRTITSDPNDGSVISTSDWVASGDPIWAAVITPTFTGYTADTPEVDAETITPDTQNAIIAVTYTANNTGNNNTGDNNTGDSNTGNSNSGSNNTGDSNTGNSNSGSNNTGDSNTGNSNSGSNNTGDSNTGNSNSGSNNTGDSNTGNSNSGSNNTGDSNTGNSNSGSNNTGDSNTGNSNSGSNNTGDSNTGNSNSGSNNTGDSNTGNSNSGSNNTGDSNTGNSNSGSNNTGDSNTGNSNSGSNNTGDSNTGNSNSGSNNTGDSNTGNSNSGSNNTGDSNTGNSNSGSNNTGDSNTGNSNSGSNNTGDSNTGNSNSGSNNTGDSNTGNSNSGSNNTGDSNTGNSNSGSNNTGDSNTGNSNSGSNNTGDSNTGNSNSGSNNTGDSNTGNSNSGSNNTGDSNSGNSNSGSNNTGDSNTGNSNSGSNNTGDGNTGNLNSGSNNTGDSNTGNSNSGSNNTGDSNTGNSNSGSNNTGDSNTGNSNSGSNNTGDNNTGNSNTGSNNTGNNNHGDGNVGNNNTGNDNHGDNLIGNDLTTPILTVTPSAVYTNNGVWNPKLNVLELIDDHGNKVDLNGIQLKEVQDEFDAKIDANVVEYRVLSGSKNKVGSMVVEFAWGNKADHGIGDYVTQTTTVTWLENQAQVLVKNSEIPLDSSWQVSDNVTVVKRMNGSIVDPGQITYKYVESADQFDDVIPDNVIEWTGSVNINVPGVYTITVAWSDPVTASFTVTIKESDGNNTGNSNSGNSNNGSNNTGNSNSGNSNSSSNNTGNSNSGNSNSGSNNTGNTNSGNSNSGSNNTGNSNFGNSNSGSNNTGHNLVTNGQGKAPNFGATQMITDTATGNFNAQTKGTKPAPNRQTGLPATEATSNDAAVLIGLTGMLAALGLLGTKKRRHES